MITQVSEDLLIGTDVASIDWKTVEVKSYYDNDEDFDCLSTPTLRVRYIKNESSFLQGRMVDRIE